MAYLVPPATRSQGSSGAAAKELLRRSQALHRLIKNREVRVVLTRNPSGVLAALGTDAKSVFDTDDGRNAGLHYWLARPFADVITSSDSDPESHGPNHLRYPGLKAQMFLNASHFRPDPRIREQFGIQSERLFVVRFSSYTAAHDRNERGLSRGVRDAILKRLTAKGAVLLSVEEHGLRIVKGCSPTTALPVPPEAFHDLLAAADLYIGDSQSIAAEAAILGVPTLHLSSFANRLFYLNYLEEKGLVTLFSPDEEDRLLEDLDQRLVAQTEPSPRGIALGTNDDTADIVEWYHELVLNLLRR